MDPAWFFCAFLQAEATTSMVLLREGKSVMGPTDCNKTGHFLRGGDLNPGERHSRDTKDDGTVTLCTLRAATVLSHNCRADFGRRLTKKVMSHLRDGPGVTAPLRTNIVPLTEVWNPALSVTPPPLKSPRQNPPNIFFDAIENGSITNLGPATTQNFVVKFDGEICGGVWWKTLLTIFPQQKKLENLLPNFAGSSPPISPKTSPTSLWKSLVLTNSMIFKVCLRCWKSDGICFRSLLSDSLRLRVLKNLLMPLFLIGCFPGDFQEGKRPIQAFGETPH